MLRRTFVLILAACLLLCAVSLAEQDPEAMYAAGNFVYEDEYLAVRLVGIVTEEDSVIVTFAFENTGTRYCAVTADLSPAMMEGDAFDALRMMQRISGGEILRSLAPGEAGEYSFSWNTGEAWTESVPAMVHEDLQPEEFRLPVEGFPKGTVAGLTILLSDGEYAGMLTALVQADADKSLILNETNTRLVELRVVSAD